MSLIIKEITVKINVIDSSNDKKDLNLKKLTDNQVDDIVEKCVKEVLKKVKQKQQR